MNSLNLWLCATFLSVPLSGSFSSNSGVCPNSWIHNLGSCYIFGNSAKTCYGANLICRAHGGTLVNINSQAENEFIHALLPASGFDSVFCIGFFRDIINPSNWFWLDGSNVTYTNWDTNQPGNYSEGCCMISVADGKWHDYSCTLFSDSRSYICEKDVDECQFPNACGAKNLVCQNTVGSYLCGCPLGFAADPESLNPLAPICLDIDECYAPDACGPDHACNNTGGSYTCECPLGYIADPAGSQNPKAVVCVDFDECQSPGACGLNQVCNNTVGSYTCECQLGFVVNSSGSQNPLELTCLDIDECQSPSACGPDHVCNNTAGSYTCECQLGFVADSGPQNPLDPVCVDFDECQSLDACGSDQVCNNTVGSYTCECSLGFVEDSGPQNPLAPVCVDLDECSNNLYDCVENTKCVNEPGSYRCICVDGYTGDGEICTDIDECVHSPVSLSCSSHSDCINFVGSFFCACREGYLGDGMTCKERQEVFEMMCKDRGGLIDAFDSHGDQRCKCAFGYVYDSETDKCLRKL